MKHYIITVRITDLTTGSSFSRKVSTYAKSIIDARIQVFQFVCDEYIPRPHTYDFTFGNVITNNLETSFL